MPSIIICIQNEELNSELHQILEQGLDAEVDLYHWRNLTHTNAEGLSEPCIVVVDSLDETFDAFWNQLSISATIVAYSDHFFGQQVLDYKRVQVRHVVARNPKDPQPFRHLLMTLEKLVSGDIFSIEKYIDAPGALREWRLSQSEDRHRLVKHVTELMTPFEDYLKFQRAVAIALEEMLTNSFFNAPVEEAGKKLYAHSDRTENIQLPPDKKLEVSCYVNHQELILSVADSYGTLPADVLLQSVFNTVESCLSIQKDSGGAGLGVSMIFSNVSHLVVNIKPGHCTEMIAIFDVGVSFSKFTRASKSLNIFMNSESI